MHPCNLLLGFKSRAMSEFWNTRYSTREYVYGKLPNQFLKEQLDSLSPGKILFPAEGEGRNAVYAARRGFQVYAFDSSETAKIKATDLAAEYNVRINYKVSGYQDVVYPKNEFDALVLIFAHMPAGSRTTWHHKLLGYLKPGGRLILEGFAKDQLQYGTGGPQDESMLFSIQELQDDFQSLGAVSVVNKIVDLNEGNFHKGTASVIRLTGIKI